MKDAVPFRRAARICLLVNGVAVLAMIFILRHGLDSGQGIGARIEYLQAFRSLWIFGWLTWITAALALIYFFVQWGSFIQTPKYRAAVIFGVLVGSTGLIPDTLAEVLYLGLLPQIAAALPVSTLMENAMGLSRFLEWDRVAALLTGFLGNGLYCVGGLILNLVSLKSKKFPQKPAWAGFPIWLAGFSLSLATLVNSPLGMAVTTAVLMIFFLLWLAVLSFPTQAKSDSSQKDPLRAVSQGPPALLIPPPSLISLPSKGERKVSRRGKKPAEAVGGL